MKKSHLAAAALIAAIGAPATQAAVVNVDSVVHGVWGYTHNPSSGAPSNLGPLNTGIQINAGDTVTIATSVTDRWNINGMSVSARGYSGDGAVVFGNTTTLDFAGQIKELEYGSLAYSIGGLLWDATYDATLANDTDTTFVAAAAGTLYLSMWDSIVSDNGGSDTSLAATITVVPGAAAAPGSAVPEPASLALAALALAGLGCTRRRKA